MTAHRFGRGGKGGGGGTDGEYGGGHWLGMGKRIPTFPGAADPRQHESYRWAAGNLFRTDTQTRRNVRVASGSGGRIAPGAAGNEASLEWHTANVVRGVIRLNQPLLKPRFRGVSHEGAFFASPFLSVPMWLRADTGSSRLAVAVYAVAMSGLFGVSALFHRCHWSPPARLRMRRLDHSMIFLAIAGTYTAIAGLTLSRGSAIFVLAVVWSGALAGIAVRLRRSKGAPKWVAALPYVGLGWVAVAVLPQLLQRLGVAGLSLTLAGGAFYTAGAIVYSRQAPDPNPAVFGYHEIFHAFVLAGAACHYAVVVFFVLPQT